MSSVANMAPSSIDAQVLVRILSEGYGPGAWHGPDLRAALADVDADAAFWRPQTERHSIAEIAVHHAYHLHHVHSRLTGEPASPFFIAGDDWFALPTASGLSWPEIQTLVAAQHARVVDLVTAIADGRVTSPLAPAEQFDLVLGITCHAVYHAGQIQLLKRLNAGGNK